MSSASQQPMSGSQVTHEPTNENRRTAVEFVGNPFTIALDPSRIKMRVQRVQCALQSGNKRRSERRGQYQPGTDSQCAQRRIECACANPENAESRQREHAPERVHEHPRSEQQDRAGSTQRRGPLPPKCLYRAWQQYDRGHNGRPEPAPWLDLEQKLVLWESPGNRREANSGNGDEEQAGRKPRERFRCGRAVCKADCRKHERAVLPVFESPVDREEKEAARLEGQQPLTAVRPVSLGQDKSCGRASDNQHGKQSHQAPHSPALLGEHADEEQCDRHRHEWVKHAGNQDQSSCQHASPVKKRRDRRERKDLGRQASGEKHFTASKHVIGAIPGADGYQQAQCQPCHAPVRQPARDPPPHGEPKHRKTKCQARCRTLDADRTYQQCIEPGEQREVILGAEPQENIATENVRLEGCQRLQRIQLRVVHQPIVWAHQYPHDGTEQQEHHGLRRRASGEFLQSGGHVDWIVA